MGDEIQAGMRRAGVGDAAGIARVHVETWRNAYAGILPDEYLIGMTRERQATSWRRTIATERGRALTMVMEEPGAGVVGFVSAGRARSGGLPLGSAVDGEVYTLYVASDFQGRGYGRALLSGSLANLFENGLEGVVVWVLANNPSRFFYEAMGGVGLATRRERFAGVELDEIGYVWREAPPAA